MVALSWQSDGNRPASRFRPKGTPSGLFSSNNLLYLLITKLPLDYARGQTVGTLIRAIVWLQDAQAPMAEMQTNRRRAD